MVKTSGWAVADYRTQLLWAEGEAIEELEGELDDDYAASDGEFLASELAAIDGELDALRAHFRTCKRAYRLSANPATRREACRKGRAIRGKAEELLAAKAMLA